MLDNNGKELTEEKAGFENAVSSDEVKENVHKDQQSMFEEEDAFSESMVVEKEDIEIDSSAASEESDEASFGDTAVFTFAKDKPEGSEIDHEELSIGELQGTAKEYYNATHSERVDDKVDELRKLVDEEFAITKETDKVSLAEQVFTEQTRETPVVKVKKDKLTEKKLRRRGIVSDDDMDMLSGVQFVEEEAVVQNTAAAEEPETNSTEYINPLEEAEQEYDVPETEDEKIISLLGGLKKKYDEEELDEPDEEYTDRSQESEILKSLRSRAITSTVSVVFTAIFAALCIYFEVAAGTKAAHPAIFEPGKYGITYALCMLQFMFAGVIFNLDGVKRAFLGLRPSKPAAEGFCAVTLCVCTLHTILSCVLSHNSASLRSYCAIGCISLLMLSVNSFIKAYTCLTSFCVAASKAPKTASFNLDRKSPEAARFEKYLDDDTTIVTIGKGSFVNGFFKKTYASPSAASGTFRMSMVILAVALVAAVVKGIISKNVYSAVCTFSAVSLAALPVNALISTALPFLLASMKAKKTQTAFIGEAACDAYENCGIISFDDTEVFPAKSVKVSSIRTYGDNRIDKVILYMAKIFEKLEGPLSYVFANSVQNIESREVEAQIVEQLADGINVKIDGREVLVGTGNFMRLYDIETTADNIDESFLHSLGSIMYMSVDGALAAKFYIKYTMNRNFEAILHAFYDAGICVGIKSLDPCITTELVCGNLKGSNYPVSVIKSSGETTVAESTESAIISLSGIHNFLKNFIRLDNLRNIYRTNAIIGFAGSVIGLGIAAFLGITGSAAVGIAFLAIFQILWCIPTVLFSVLSK